MAMSYSMYERHLYKRRSPAIRTAGDRARAAYRDDWLSRRRRASLTS
jgi:hypothetical protein